MRSLDFEDLCKKMCMFLWRVETFNEIAFVVPGLVRHAGAFDLLFDVVGNHRVVDRMTYSFICLSSSDSPGRTPESAAGYL